MNITVIRDELKYKNESLQKLTLFYVNKTISILYNALDREIIGDNNHLIYQYSATNKFSISIPYRPNFWPKSKKNNKKFFFDFAFVGNYNPWPRTVFLKTLDRLIEKKSYKKLIQYDRSFCGQYHTSFETDKKNLDTNYEMSINNSKICLSPRGNGLQSIRFYEAMMSGNIPLFYGSNKTKLPLHWIINWKDLIPILREKNLNEEYLEKIINRWISMDKNEIIERGLKCQKIFYKYLNIHRDNQCLKEFIEASNDFAKFENNK